MKNLRLAFTIIFATYLITNLYSWVTGDNVGHIILRTMFLVLIIASMYIRNKAAWLFLLSFMLYGLYIVLSGNESSASEPLVSDTSHCLLQMIQFKQLEIRLLFLPVFHPVVYLVFLITLLTKPGRKFWRIPEYKSFMSELR